MEVVLSEVPVGTDESVGLILDGGDTHEDLGAVLTGLSEPPGPVGDGTFQLVREDGTVRVLLKLKRKVNPERTHNDSTACISGELLSYPGQDFFFGQDFSALLLLVALFVDDAFVDLHPAFVSLQKRPAQIEQGLGRAGAEGPNHVSPGLVHPLKADRIELFEIVVDVLGRESAEAPDVKGLETIAPRRLVLVPVTLVLRNPQAVTEPTN